MGTTGGLSGGVLVGALGIMSAGAAIGFLAPSLRDAPWEGDLVAIAGNPTAWVWANGLILAAGILTTLGLVALSLRMEGRSRPWAWMGMVAFAFSAVFLAIDRILSMSVTIWATGQDLDPAASAAYEAFERLDGVLSDWFYILGFFALGLYGIALTQIRAARERGWVFVVVGVLGILVALFGAAIPVMVFFGTAALGIATWRLDVPQPESGTANRKS